MKVQDSGAAATGVQQTGAKQTGVQQTGVQQVADGKKKPNATGFSKVLARKSQDSPESDDASWALPPMTAAPPLAGNTVSSAAPAVRADAAAIQSLVQEILVVAQPKGANRVEIQFNSKTLEGLHVQISQDQDQIAIRFSAASASTSNLLSRNLDQLTAALHSKGLQVAPIQVELAPRTVDHVPRASGSRDGRRQQGEEGRQQRQQQR